MLTFGRIHTCGLREDGVAVCWGSNHGYDNEWIGQATPPEDERFVSITAGKHHTCGLREDGKVICWGSNFDDEGIGEAYKWIGQATPTEDESFTYITASWHHTCGLREDGFAVCWGDILDRALLPTGDGFRRTTPYCGYGNKSVAVCWDENSDRKKVSVVGDDDLIRTSPYCWSPEEGIAVCIGGEYEGFVVEVPHCGLRKDGVVVCSRLSEYGQWSPPEAERFTNITPHCGLRADGVALCWALGDSFGLKIAPPEDEQMMVAACDRAETCSAGSVYGVLTAPRIGHSKVKTL